MSIDNTNTNGGAEMDMMSNRDLMRRAPSTAVIIAATVAFVAVVGAFTVLIVSGKDTTSLADLVQRATTALAALLGAGGLAYSASAARSAAAAQQQTNGSLDPRIRAAVGAELDARMMAPLTQTQHLDAALGVGPNGIAPAPAPAVVKLQPGDAIPGSYPNATVPDGPVPTA